MDSDFYGYVLANAEVVYQTQRPRRVRGRPKKADDLRTCIATLIPVGTRLSIAIELDRSEANLSAKIAGIIPWQARDLRRLVNGC